MPPIIRALALGTMLVGAGCARAGSATQRASAPPDCAAAGSSAPALGADWEPPTAPPQSQGGPPVDIAPAVLRLVADVPMPGGKSRFDYQSVDDAHHRLYLSHMGAGQLIVFDTRVRKVLAVVNDLPNVTGVWAVPELDRVYASVPGSRYVVAVDTKAFRVMDRIGEIGFPDGLAYAPSVKKVFVSDEAGGGELVIDALRNQVVGKIPLGGEAGNTIYDPGSGCILVAVQTTNEVVAIDPATTRVVGRYAFDGADHPHGMYVDAPRRLLFVANQGNATLSVIDLRSMQVTGHMRVGDGPDVLAFDPEWRRLYVASEAGLVAVFDERGARLVRAGELSMPAAHTVAVSPTTHLVYFPLEDVSGRAVLRIMEGIPPAE